VILHVAFYFFFFSTPHGQVSLIRTHAQHFMQHVQSPHWQQLRHQPFSPQQSDAEQQQTTQRMHGL